MPEFDVVANLQTLAAADISRPCVSPTAIGSALGWNADEIRQRQINAGAAPLDVGRGFLGVQPAALFASCPNGEIVSPGAAALYGYHASVRWGIIADKTGLTPFNSHWTLQDRWYVLPRIDWHDLEANRSLLECFRPAALADGALDRLALDTYPRPELLRPVDEELVSRLDDWRDQALKSSRVDSGVDEQLQTLFAKLFVLRTIEDRGLANDVPPLSECLVGATQLRLDLLIVTFEAAQHYIGSDLFDTIELDKIPSFVIAGIIHDLYFARRLPYNQRYNFSWIDADVLGMAYEKYLSTILNSAPLPPQMSLFDNPLRGVEGVSVRRANGVYYTPQYLTRYLAGKTVEEFYRGGDELRIPRIIDFACGSGSFLVAAIDTLLQQLKRIDPARDWGRHVIEGGYIAGVDLDEKAVTVARLNIWNRLAEEPDPLPLPNLSKVVTRGDGLDRSSWGELDGQYDIALGNPPFLATARIFNRDRLEFEFETAKGRYDYSYLFVEQAVKVVAPEGIIGLVVPNRLFRNNNGSIIRSVLTKNTDILTIVDFGSNEVFQGTSAYVGCLVAKFMSSPLEANSSVTVIDVKSISPQFVASSLSYAEDNGVDDSSIRSYVAQHPRGSAPWVLLSREEQRSQIQVKENSVDLASIAGIYQGIRTGANDIFILQIESEDDRYGAQVTNGLGQTAILERTLLQPVVYGSEVKKYSAIDFGRYLVYPYLNGSVVSEAEMAARYPQTYKYLLSYRDILSARSSAISSGVNWYELVRRRDEDWLKRQKLLIRDLAPETSFAVDISGGVFIVGGTAVIPERDDLLFALMMYLNSGPINTLVRRTTPQFRGSFQKFEPQHLQRIPVLTQVLEDPDFTDHLNALGREIANASSANARSLIAQQADRIISFAMNNAGLSSEE